MNRRALLGAIAVGGSLVAGCLDGNRSSTGDDGTSSSDDDGSPSNDGSAVESPAVPSATGDCGVGTEPLSSRLVEDGGETAHCHEELTPSLELANERKASVSATLTVESDGESVFEAQYDLESGKHVLEQGTATAGELESLRLSIAGESTNLTGDWPTLSCCRHAVVLTADGMDVGYVKPLAGPADTQHDCYAGDSAAVRIHNGDAPRTVTVSIVDHCAETITEEELELDGGEVTSIDESLTSGGNYAVVVDVEDGGGDRYDFDEECWGLTASIDDEGTVEIERIGID